MAEWLIQTAILTGIGIIAYFLKSFKTDQAQNDAELKQQIDSVESKLADYKLEVADKFVQKDDFIRATAQTDRKLDRIYEKLMEMNQKTEAKP
ncbi:hypothetical protein P9B03_08535 [Metasolibacillus meyeri]|uniref:Uncharacterized protein n=1 Tax=Metasolibacillus meyeri TaxID=1071052 RepID=A0AAW9NVE7_9BACL|nr:hypothetical protein [Metasolibacillus meyeri]MEC1178525.1 hypothetical protein [Metasolibacillus meyeri]